MSLYGAEDLTTPFMDAVAEKGTYFERAYAQQTTRAFSAFSYLTGLYPYPGTDPPPKLINQTTPTLASLFNGAGYKTAAFSDNPFIIEARFGAGFDEFTDVRWRKKRRPARHQEYLIATRYRRSGWCGSLETLFQPRAVGHGLRIFI